MLNAQPWDLGWIGKEVKPLEADKEKITKSQDVK